MALHLKSLSDDRATVAFDYLGETVHVTYRPHAVTPATYGKLRDEPVPQFLPKYLATVLVDWDVLGDDGEPIPTTEAALQDVPTRFLSEVFYRVGEDSRQGEANASSAAG